MTNNFIPRGCERKWEISVAGGAYLPSLATDWGGGDIEFSFEDDMGPKTFAYSVHADALSDPKDVAGTLLSLQLLLNGALRLHWSSCDEVPISFMEFVDLNGSGFHPVGSGALVETVLNQPIDERHLRGGMEYPKTLLRESQSDDPLRALMFQVGLVSRNTFEERVLAWSTLYKIYDTVLTMCKTMGKSAGDFGDPKELSAFTAACNNSSILGVQSRHGVKNYGSPPKKVITDQSEAVQLIIDFAAKCCREHMGSDSVPSAPTARFDASKYAWPPQRKEE